MTANPRATAQPAMLPAVRCSAGSAPRAHHEWAPRRDGGYYCTACLSQLSPADVEDWKLLLEFEVQRGDAALSGDAYATLSDMVAKTLTLSQSECRVLQRLAAEPSYVVRHGELAEALWGGSSAAAHDRAALRQHVTSLRRKLLELRVGIGAVPSIGYRLAITSGEPDDQ